MHLPGAVEAELPVNRREDRTIDAVGAYAATLAIARVGLIRSHDSAAPDC